MASAAVDLSGSSGTPHQEASMMLRNSDKGICVSDDVFERDGRVKTKCAVPCGWPGVANTPKQMKGKINEKVSTKNQCTARGHPLTAEVGPKSAFMTGRIWHRVIGISSYAQA